MTTDFPHIYTEQFSIDHDGVDMALWRCFSDLTPATGAATVVMAHGFGGTINEALLRYAARFAAVGLNVILFDYRCFGRSGGWPRQWMSIARRHEDYEHVIEWCKQQHHVASDSIILWGSSLSGGHVMDIASRKHFIKGVIAQAPFADGKANTGSLRTAIPLLYSALRDKWREKRNKYPYYIASVGYPGQIAAMTSPDAIPDDLWQQNIDANWENRTTPRVFLEVVNWQPGLATPSIQCPLLVQVATKDEVTPPEPAQKAAELAPHGQCINYHIEHFEIYHGEAFERTIADQIAFIKSIVELPDSVVQVGGSSTQEEASESSKGSREGNKYEA
ncbi:alpha/beta hydrolase [Glaciecola siphonariae]|uniref:Alpha/beta hydrolase n=1 Tax=Glaciecola siphonariae TaxID=521012 RepID=A0ABV9LYV7_9ALTE